MHRLAVMASAIGFTLVGLACSMGGDEGGEWEGRGGGGRGMVERATVVEVHEVGTGSVGDRLTSSAVVESEAMANLFPATTGIVKEVRVEEGDPVREGQVLAVIDNASMAAGSQRARADVERLQTELTRLESLAAQGAVSSREVDEARYSLTTAQTAAWEAGAGVGQTRIKSPIDGIVAVRDVREGELAGSAARAFQVVDLDRLRVVASLPERDLPRVATGQPVTLVSAYDPDVQTTGSVTRVAPVVDATSGTFRVTVDLDPGQSVLRPGQFVSVEIEVDRHDDVLVVPREAVVYEDGAPVVYRMVERETEPDTGEDEEVADADADSDTEPTGPKYEAERVSIETGLIDATWAEITTGIDAGDQVVVIGQSNLRDGAPIRTPDMAAAQTDAGDDGDNSEDAG